MTSMKTNPLLETTRMFRSPHGDMGKATELAVLHLLLLIVT